MKNTIRQVLIIGIIITALISCKKDKSASVEIAIASDETYHLNTSVYVKEVWLNYATKKSQSEWVKLNIIPGVYDLSDLYLDQRDTIILTQTKIEDITTLLQLRFTFGAENNSIITQGQDTLSMTMSADALSGLKVSLNKQVETGNIYDIRLAIKGDSTSIHEAEPIFVPSIRLDSLSTK